MATEIALCVATNCMHNQQGLCTRDVITLDKNGYCDTHATQEPLPEPSK